MVVKEEIIIEEGLLQLNNQNADSECRITACVIFSTFVAVCGSFSFGVATGYTSGAEIGIMKDLDLSVAQFSAFGSFCTLGAAIGALFSCKMAIILGRKGTMWVSDFFCITGWLSIAFAKVPVYIAEIAPKHLRGTFTFSNQLLQNSGLSMVYFCGNFIGWRTLALLGFSVGIGSTMLGLLMIPKAIIGVILVDKWGRRPLLLASVSGMTITSLLLGVAFTLQKMQLLSELTPIFTFICLTCYIGAYAIGLGGLPWVIMSEIFPINIKVTAGSIVTLATWSSSSIVLYVFNFLFEWSTQGTFYIFGAMGGAALLFIWLLVPETKGLSLEEVQASLIH